MELNYVTLRNVTISRDPDTGRDVVVPNEADQSGPTSGGIPEQATDAMIDAASEAVGEDLACYMGKTAFAEIWVAMLRESRRLNKT